MRRSLLALGLVVCAGLVYLLYVTFGTGAPSASASTSSSKERNQKMKSGLISLSLGESGAVVVKRSQAPIKRGQVAGLAFYESSDIENGSEPTLRLLHAGKTLELPISRSVLLTADEGRGRGIEDIDLSLKMPASPKDPKNTAAFEAYDRQVFEIVTEAIRRVNATGWNRYIDPSRARLQGLQTYLDGNGSQPDPTYPLTLKDWIVLSGRSITWEWYQSGAFLRLVYRAGRGSAVVLDSISVNIESERLGVLAYDPNQEGNMQSATQALRAALPDLLASRLAAEAKAAAGGQKVLTNWIDPPIGGVEVPKH